MTFSPIHYKRLLCVLLFSVTLACTGQEQGDTLPGDDRQSIDVVEDSTPTESLMDTEDALVKVRAVPNEVPERMKKEKEFLYANDSTYWKVERPRDPSLILRLEQILSSKALKVVLYIALAAFVIFVLYQVVIVNKFSLFSKSGKRRQKEKLIEDNQEDNLEDNLEKAIEEGNYRLATRLSYLITLARLSGRQEIKLQAMATNHDYLRQMQSSPRFQDFSRLTTLYEYVWYGEFEPNRKQFETINSHFMKFNKQT